MMDDLEKGFSDVKALAKSKQRPPFRVFADQIHKQDQDEGIKFWKDRIDNVERFDLLAEEDKTRDFLSGKTDMKVKYMPFKRPQSRIGLNAINQVASALMLANESEEDDIFFMQMRSCRQLPIENIDQVFGPFWSPCPVRRKLDGSQTLQSLLEQASRETNEAIPYEPFGWPATLEKFGHRRFLQFVTVMQPPKTANYDADFSVRDEEGQELTFKSHSAAQMRNFFGLYMMSTPTVKGDQLEVWARYHDKFVSSDRVDELMDKFMAMFDKLLTSDWDEVKVSELCPHLETSPEDVDDSSLPNTLTGIFRNRTKAPALIIPGEQSLTLSHKELHGLVGQIQRHLAKLGIKKGSACSIALPNCMELIVCFLATTWQRGIAAPLNPDYKQDEFEFYIEDLGSDVVIIPQGQYEQEGAAVKAARKYEAAIAEAYWDGEARRVVFEVKEPGKMAKAGEQETLKAAEDDVALVLHTSGTTGRPKAVPLSHANLLASIRNICHTYKLTPKDRTMLIMPLFHVHGLLASFLSPLYSGGSAIIPPRLTPSFWPDFETHKATWYTATPSMHRIILQFDPPKTGTLNRIRFVRSCSSQLSEALFHQLSEKLKSPILESYAMTEASHLMTSNPLPLRGKAKPGSVGRAAEGLEVCILDEEGHEVEQGKEGEVSIRGANVTAGYLNNEEANASSFTSDGFFRTGDQGKFDEEGYLFLTGRLKEMINKGGEKISPVELDNVISKHEKVAEAVSFAIEDEAYGQDVGLAVKVGEGQELGEEELREWIEGKVAKFKVPKKIWFPDEIPKTATGKVQRRLVAEKMQKGE